MDTAHAALSNLLILKDIRSYGIYCIYKSLYIDNTIYYIVVLYGGFLSSERKNVFLMESDKSIF